MLVLLLLLNIVSFLSFPFLFFSHILSYIFRTNCKMAAGVMNEAINAQDASAQTDLKKGV